DDEVAVPLLKHVEVAAGSGRSADEFKTSKKIRLGKYTLRNQGVQFDMAVCVTVRGNSMEPALPVRMKFSVLQSDDLRTLEFSGA
ncbi:hypothetical protein AAIH34_34745, partial [Pseudomonas aeruginosa]